MKIKKENIIRFVLIILLMIIFITLWILMANNYIENFDNNVYRLVENIRSEKLTILMKFITGMGGRIVLVLFVLTSLLISIITKKKSYGIAITLNIMLSSLTYVVLKNIIQRPRPPMDERLIEESGFSFPSGHTTNSVAFYGFMVYLIYTKISNKKLRNVLCVLVSILPIAIGFSRIYLKVHYPSDVMAGFCIGVISLIVFISTIYKKIENIN